MSKKGPPWPLFPIPSKPPTRRPPPSAPCRCRPFRKSCAPWRPTICAAGQRNRWRPSTRAASSSPTRISRSCRRPTPGSRIASSPAATFPARCLPIRYSRDATSPTATSIAPDSPAAPSRTASSQARRLWKRTWSTWPLKTARWTSAPSTVAVSGPYRPRAAISPVPTWPRWSCTT